MYSKACLSSQKRWKLFVLLVLLKLKKKQALPCFCLLLKAVKTLWQKLDLQKNDSLALWVYSFTSILYLYWFEKKLFLQVGRGSWVLCTSECTAYGLPRWALCRGLLLLTHVTWFGAPNVPSCSKWPFWNNPVVMSDCEIVDWKLQALQEKAIVLCWHPVLEVDAHQYQSCSSNVCWLACEV